MKYVYMKFLLLSLCLLFSPFLSFSLSLFLSLSGQQQRGTLLSRVTFIGCVSYDASLYVALSFSPSLSIFPSPSPSPSPSLSLPLFLSCSRTYLLGATHILQLI